MGIVCITRLIQKAQITETLLVCEITNQQRPFTVGKALNVANRPPEGLPYPQETMCGCVGTSLPGLLLSLIHHVPGSRWF